MPSISLTGHTSAPVEEVWKLLHDPRRFPEWWAGIENVRPGEAGDYTVWHQGYPDFPMAQHLSTDQSDGRVIVSCLVSDLEFRWQLREMGNGTDIELLAELPEREAAREPAQRALLAESMQRLAVLAGSS